MKRTIFFPALSFHTEDYFLRGINLRKDDKDIVSLAFFKKEALFYHPYILFSASCFYREKNLLKDYGIDLEKNKDLIILGDSGGYQIAKGVLEKNKIEKLKYSILEWLENNSRFAMVLDSPLYMSDIFCDREELFDSSLMISEQWFRYFYENKKNKTRFLNILHGRNLRQLNEWYAMMRNFDFDGGIAIGSCSVSPIYYPLQSFFFLLKNGALEKFKDKSREFYLLHFLGISNTETAIYLSYIQKWLDKNGYNIIVSYDSSNATSSAGRGHCSINNSFVRMHFKDSFSRNLNYIDDFDNVIFPSFLLNNVDLTFKDTLKLLFNKRGSEDIYTRRSYFYLLMSISNLYNLVQYYKFMDSLIQYGNFDLYKYMFKDESIIEKFEVIDKLFEADAKDYIDILYKNKKLFLSENNINDDLNLF